jgi:hypothetical protein
MFFVIYRIIIVSTLVGFGLIVYASNLNEKDNLTQLKENLKNNLYKSIKNREELKSFQTDVITKRNHECLTEPIHYNRLNLSFFINSQDLFYSNLDEFELEFNSKV